MSENNLQKEQVNPQNAGSEIDLLTVIIKIFNWIGRAIMSILNPIGRFIKRYFLLFFIVACLGAIYSVIVGNLKPVYKSEMVISPGIVNGEIILNRLDILKTIVNNRDFSGLAKALDLTLEEAEKIVYFKVEDNIDKAYRGKMDSLTYTKEYITVYVRTIESNAVFSKLEPKIINFINKDPYIGERLDAFIEANIARQKAIETEIATLSSLQEKVIERLGIESSGTRGQLVFMNNDQKTFYNEMLSLQGELIGLKENAKLVKPATILQEFVIPQKPDRHSILIWQMIKNICFSLFFAMIIFIMRDLYLSGIWKDYFTFKHLREK